MQQLMRRILPAVIVATMGSQPVQAQWSRDHSVSRGPAGMPAKPWRQSNPRSFDPKTFGLTNGPVGDAFGALVLPDGRCAAVFEQTILDARGNFINYLFVRTCHDGKWVDVVAARELRNDGPADGKSKFVRRWGSLVFPMGYMQYEKMAWTARPDGTVKLLMGWSAKSTPPDHRRLDLLRFKDGKWLPDQTLRLEVPGSGSGNVHGYQLSFDDKGHPVYVELRNDPPPGGRVRYRPRVVIRRWQQDAWQDMDYLAPDLEEGQVPTSVSRVVMDPAGTFDLLVVGRQKVLSRGADRRVVTAGEYFKREGDRWLRLLEPPMEEKVKEFGLPIGRGPDGMPVWLHTRTEGPGELAQQMTVVTLEGGDLVFRPLPRISPRVVQGFYTGKVHLGRSAAGNDILTLVGTYRLPGRREGRAHLYVGVYRFNGKQWTDLAQGPWPAYRRPFHGGHDGISSAVAAVGKQQALLLWSNPIPIHGPDALFALRAEAEELPGLD